MYMHTGRSEQIHNQWQQLTGPLIEIDGSRSQNNKVEVDLNNPSKLGFDISTYSFCVHITYTYVYSYAC